MAKQPKWSELETPHGNGEALGALVRAFAWGDARQREAAMQELPMWLIEDGDRFSATVRAISELVATCRRLDGAALSWLVELLQWLAVGDPAAALREPLAPVDPDPSEAGEACRAEVSRVLPQLLWILGGEHVAAERELLALLANVPLQDPSPILASCEAKGSDAAARARRGLARLAYAKQVGHGGPSMRGTPRGVEAVLVAGARLITTPSREAWDDLAAALSNLRRCSLPKAEVAALPGVLRDGGWLRWALALLARASFVDHGRLIALLVPQIEHLDGETLAIVAQGIFVDEPSRPYAGLQPDALSPLERGFLEALTEASTFADEPHDWLTHVGLPVGALDDYVVSKQRALKRYLGLEKADVYRRALSGRPVYVWAHGVVRGEVKATALVSALRATRPATAFEIVMTLSRPPEDLASDPAYDRRTLHVVVKAVLRGLDGVAKRVAARLEQSVGDGEALALLEVAGPADLDPERVSDLVMLRGLPGTGELARALLADCSPELRAAVVDTLGWDEVADTERDALICGWELAALHPDRRRAAADAVSAVPAWETLATEAFQFARVERCLDALRPESCAAIRAALRDGESVWDPWLRRFAER